MSLKKIKEAVSTLLSIVRHKNTEFLFRTPRKADVLILDSVNANRLSAAFLQGIDFAVLDARYKNEKLKFRIYLSPKIAYFAMRMLLARWSPWDSYCYAIIRCISPKVVIDNVHLLYVLPLAREMPNVRFFVILNGFHCDILDKSIVESNYIYALKEKFQSHPQRVSNFHIFCFGKKDSDIFRQCGLDEASTGIQYHDVGSIYGDYMKSRLCGDVNRHDFDFVFVSQCDHDSIFASEKIHRMLVENTSKAIANLSRYIVEKNQRCLILLRGEPDIEQSEIAFYKSLFDVSAQIEFHRRDSAFSVYRGMNKAPIIVSLYSTIGFEAMSWGKKVLFCLYGFTKVYKISSAKYASDTDMLTWSLENSEYDAFSKRLDELVKMELPDYLNQVAEATSYIISGSSGKPAHIYVREKILAELG